jgi:hypothetical protein
LGDHVILHVNFENVKIIAEHRGSLAKKAWGHPLRKRGGQNLGLMAREASSACMKETTVQKAMKGRKECTSTTTTASLYKPLCFNGKKSISLICCGCHWIAD